MWPAGRCAALAAGSGLWDELHKQTQNEKRYVQQLKTFQFWGGVDSLPTECDQRGDDRHGQRSHEKVDGPGQEGDLPHTGVTQANNIGVGVVHLDVALDASLGREGAADLSRRTEDICLFLIYFFVFLHLVHRIHTVVDMFGVVCFFTNTQITIDKNNQAAGSISVLIGSVFPPVLFRWTWGGNIGGRGHVDVLFAERLPVTFKSSLNSWEKYSRHDSLGFKAFKRGGYHSVGNLPLLTGQRLTWGLSMLHVPIFVWTFSTVYPSI